MIRRRPVLAAVLLGLSLLPLVGALEARAEGAGPTVFAAASLKNAFDAVNGAWVKQGGRPATLSYAASSALARQIEGGAPADVFASADLAWMDHLDAAGLIVTGTRTELLGNEIVLVAPKDSTADLAIAQGFDLAAALGEGRLAMANVEAVPAGRYGKQALEALGVWAGVKDRVAQAENVRAALLLVSRGEAPLGIVYRTDAAADPSVKIVGTFPADSHAPIVYPVAVTTQAKSPDAGAFVAFLKSDAARAIFAAQGFKVLAKD